MTRQAVVLLVMRARDEELLIAKHKWLNIMSSPIVGLIHSKCSLV